MCALAENLDSLHAVPGLCYRGPDGQPTTNPPNGNPDKLDDLPWPQRISFPSYYGKPIASILTSRGCWRDCAFCSINAWYQRVGGKRFRIRGVDSSSPSPSATESNAGKSRINGPPATICPR